MEIITKIQYYTSYKINIKCILKMLLSKFFISLTILSLYNLNAIAQTVSNFSTGVTFTQYSLDEWGNDAAIESGKILLNNSTTIVNQHLMGFGALNAELFEDQYDFSSIDVRIGKTNGVGKDADIIVLTACCAPDWMKGIPTDTTNWDSLEVAPFREHYDDYAELVAEIVKQPEFSNIKYVQVWNEMKGFWDVSQDRWNHEGYTELYNLVWNKVKAVRPDIKIGGPYVVLGSYGSEANAREKCSGELYGGAWGKFDCRDLKVVEYWLKNKSGADFITVDAHIKNTDTIYPVDQFERTEKFADFATWLRSLDNNQYPGAQTLPLWWAEWYTIPDNPEASEAEKNALMTTGLIKMIKSGAATALLWGPQGDENGDMFPLGLFSDTRNANGGQPTLFYKTQQYIYNEFGEGRSLMEIPSTNNKVEILGSQAKSLLVNKSGITQNVNIRGTVFALEAFEVRLVDTPLEETNDCNLISNGNFSRGTNDWITWGCEAESNAEICTISNIQDADNLWNAALAQGGFTIENGASYEISFDAASIENNKTIQVKVGLGESPYTGYHHELVELKTYNNRYTIRFTMSQPTTSKARLEFQIGSNTIGLKLDNVKLVAISDECNENDNECNSITNGDFSIGKADWQGWHCKLDVIDEECKITDINNSDAAVVQGLFNLESEKYYELSFDAASIQNNKEIKVKVALGEWPYTLYLRRTINLYTNKKRFTIPFKMYHPTTSKARLSFKVGSSATGVLLDNVQLIPLFDDCNENNNECNSLTNGDFSIGKMDWYGWNCKMNVIDEECKITDIKQGNAALVHSLFTLESGQRFEVSFDGTSAQNNREIKVKIAHGEKPYTVYMQKTIKLYTNKKQFTIPFTMQHPTTSKARLSFKVGSNTTGVTLDNVQLISPTDDCAYYNRSYNELEEYADEYLKVYPNPTYNELNIFFDTKSNNENGTIQLLNLDGSVLMEDQIMLTNSNKFQLDLKSISPGIYILIVNTGEQMLQQKVIKY